MRTLVFIAIAIFLSVCRSSEVTSNDIMSESQGMNPSTMIKQVNGATDRGDTDEVALKQLENEVKQVNSEETDIKALENDERELEQSTGTQVSGTSSRGSPLQSSDYKDRYEGDYEDQDDDDDDESQGEGPDGGSEDVDDVNAGDEDVEKMDDDDDDDEDAFGRGRGKVQGSIQRPAFGGLWLQVMMGIFAIMICVAISLWSKGLSMKLRGTSIGRSMAEMGYSAV